MAAKKKPAAKKKAAAPAKKRVTAIKEPMTKTQIITTIAEKTELSRKEVQSVFTELETLVEGHVKKNAAGSFTLPGLLKVVTQKVPARKAKKNVPNPFKPGELMDVKARPASVKVKVRPLKKLKDFVS